MISTRFNPLSLVVLLAALVFVTGCSTTRHGAARISTNPSGMEVVDMADGSTIGVTPVTYLWRSKDTRRKYMNIRLQKAGQEDIIRSFWLNLDYSSAEDAMAQPQNVQIDVSTSTE